VIAKFLARLERDERGLAIRLYPFLDNAGADDRSLAIDPRFGFGRPVLAGTGVRIELLPE